MRDCFGVFHYFVSLLAPFGGTREFFPHFTQHQQIPFIGYCLELITSKTLNHVLYCSEHSAASLHNWQLGSCVWVTFKIISHIHLINLATLTYLACSFAPYSWLLTAERSLFLSACPRWHQRRQMKLPSLLLVNRSTVTLQEQHEKPLTVIYGMSSPREPKEPLPSYIYKERNPPAGRNSFPGS